MGLAREPTLVSTEDPVYVPIPQELSRVKTGDLIVHKEGHACLCSGESEYGTYLSCPKAEDCYLKKPSHDAHAEEESEDDENDQNDENQRSLVRLITADSLDSVLEYDQWRSPYDAAFDAACDQVKMSLPPVCDASDSILIGHPPNPNQRPMQFSPSLVPPTHANRNPPSRTPSMDIPPPLTEAKVESPLPRGLSRTICPNSGAHTIQWTIEARKLKSSDRQIVSPAFELMGKPIPFKLMVFPVSSTEFTGGSSFRNAGGKGFIQLKCDGTSKDMTAFPLDVSFFIHSPERWRGPVKNDFFEKPMCGLEKNVSSWNLKEAVTGAFFIIGIIVNEYELESE